MRNIRLTVRCRCGHLRASHQHYRKGTDCSPLGGCLYDCQQFRLALRPRREVVTRP